MHESYGMLNKSLIQKKFLLENAVWTHMCMCIQVCMSLCICVHYIHMCVFITSFLSNYLNSGWNGLYPASLLQQTETLSVTVHVFKAQLFINHSFLEENIEWIWFLPIFV
jgi:hypothetical protein